MIALIRYWREGIMGLLLIALAVSMIALKLEKRHSAKQQAQIVTLSAELQRISTARDEQHKATDTSIAKANDGIKAVQPVKHRLETAPIPANCKTPGIEAAREVL